MKIVNIEVRAANDGEVVTATIVEQRREGSGWKEFGRHVVRSDDVGARRTLLLEDNERVIIDGRPATKVVMDYSQGAAVEVPIEYADVEVQPAAAPVLEPMPSGHESQVGVWREAGEQDWSRTGARYPKVVGGEDG